MIKRYFFILAMCIFMLSAVGQTSPKDDFETACGGYEQAPITKKWDGSYTPCTKGSGTHDDPYQITEPEHLAYMAQCVKYGVGAEDNVVFKGVYFILMINIDLNNIEWTPIGYRIKDSWHYFFGGHFNGNGHTISGLFVNCKDEWLGLFGGIKDGSVICLKVKGEIERKDPPIPTPPPPPPIPPPPPPPPPHSDPYAGGIVGYAENTTIQYCYSECNIHLENTDPTFIGGIAGACIGGDISFCGNTGKLIAFSAWKTIYVGGIAGYTTATVSNSYNTGEISSVFDDASEICCRGGIVGYSNADITDCYNMGNIFGECSLRRFSGGIVAAALDNTIKNCYNAGGISHTEGGVNLGKKYNNVEINNCYYRDDLGGNNSLGGTPKTESFMKTTEMVELLETAFWQDLQDVQNGIPYFNQGYPILFNRDLSVGITEPIALHRVAVYPNPANNQLLITNYELRNNAADYSIYNIMGQMLMQGTLQGETTILNVEPLAKGIYYLKIADEAIKFIKE